MKIGGRKFLVFFPKNNRITEREDEKTIRTISIKFTWFVDEISRVNTYY